MSDDRFELKLSPDLAQLLRDVVTRHDPGLIPLLAPGASLVRSDVTALIQAISDEFVTGGLGVGYEPSDYGLKLEALLDAVNRHGFS
ncbi:MAG: hypothetical protein WCB85_08205 [Candidatus Dormiibacterota bacterium]